jgi:hypothetical protein
LLADARPHRHWIAPPKHSRVNSYFLSMATLSRIPSECWDSQEVPLPPYGANRPSVIRILDSVDFGMGLTRRTRIHETRTFHQKVLYCQLTFLHHAVDLGPSILRSWACVLQISPVRQVSYWTAGISRVTHSHQIFTT